MSRLRLTGPARVVLAALTVLTPMGLGGVLDWVAPAALALAVVALALTLFHHRDARLPGIALLPLLALALCLLQLVPLPPPLLHLLSPEAESLREFALVPLGLTRWRPVSLDPGATWAEVTKALLYLVTILAAYQAARSRTGTPWLIGTVAALGPLFVGIGLVHAMLGLDELFGVYGFREAAPRLLTPFGDTNHLAGLMILSGSACVAMVASNDQRSRRIFWAIAWFIACGGALLSGSRAGITVFLVTQLFLVGWVAYSLRGTDDARRSGRALTLAATFLIGLGVGAYTLGESIWARFAQAGTDATWMKSLVWPRVMQLVRDYWPLGCGRGSFLLAFTRYNVDHSTYTHPENIVLQWSSELGVPGALLLLAAGAVLVWALLRANRTALLTFAPLVGAVGVMVHNLADFSLEYPGVTVPLCVVLGCCAATPSAEPRRLHRAALLIPVLLLGLLAVWRTGESYRHAEDRLQEVALAARQAKEVTAVANGRIDSHPADHLLYTYAAMAEVSLKGGDPRNGLAYANRALLLNPNDASAHYAAARALRRLGRRDQALLEYRLASSGPGGQGAYLQEGAAYAKTTDELRRLGGADPDLLAAVARLQRGEVAAQLMTEASQLPQAKEQLTLEAVGQWVALGRLDIAQQLLDLADAQGSVSPQLAIARARLDLARKDPEGAGQVLDEALKKFPGNFELTLERVQLLVGQGRLLPAAKLLQEASAIAVHPDQRLELSLVEAQVDVGLGRLNHAIELYQGAVLRSPSTRTHQALAGVYAKAARYDDAIAELRAAEHFEGKAGQDALEASIHSLEAQRDARRAPAP